VVTRVVSQSSLAQPGQTHKPYVYFKFVLSRNLGNILSVPFTLPCSVSFPRNFCLIVCIFELRINKSCLALSDPTSKLVRQYDFPVLLRCRKTSDTVFVAFVRPLLEPVRRFSSCSTGFSQQIAQVVLFLFLCVCLF
jgi:hypothetical protein